MRKVREMATGLTGEIKVGDPVKTLNRKQAVYGRVRSINKKKKLAVVEGRTQPGALSQLYVVHVEDLDLITPDELCPEDQ